MSDISANRSLRIGIHALAAAWTVIMAILPLWGGEDGLPSIEWGLAIAMVIFALGTPYCLPDRIDAVRRGVGVALAAAAIALAWMHVPGYGNLELVLLGYGIICLPWIAFGLSQFRLPRAVLGAFVIVSAAIVVSFVTFITLIGLS